MKCIRLRFTRDSSAQSAATATACPRRPLGRKKDEGQVIILFALFSFVLVGALALALDVGYLMAERRAVQAAADSAALAAARSAMDGTSMEAITETAISYGETNAGDDAIVAVVSPPSSGHFQGDNGYYQVTVTKDLQKFFLGAIYQGDWYVEATATAAVGMDGFGSGILALNSNEGGIVTSGSSRMHVSGGSIVSNYNIDTSGSTSLTSTEWIVANDGIESTGSWTIHGDQSYSNEGVNASGPEVVDPLAEVLDPPTLPSFPGNPVAGVNPSNQSCPGQTMEYWPLPQPSDYVGTPGTYSGGGNNCVNVSGPSGPTYVFPNGNYRLRNGAGITLSYGNQRFDGGTYNFEGGAGITVTGTNPYVELRAGNYSFTGGARINIGGSAPQNILGGGGVDSNDSYFYFSGGGGIETGGSNRLILYPGTYIFDGGPGLTMSGSSQLEFMPGSYEFYFGNGADFRVSGSSRIILNGNPYVKAHFYGTQNNNSDMAMSGSTVFHVPSGEYYFDRGSMINSGSAAIIGEGVFLYFKNGGHVQSSGSAAFAFTALTTQIYPGFFPGVYMYSDRSNTATFYWSGTTSTVSTGIVYLPNSPLEMSGSSSGKMWRGQLIADRFRFSGSNSTEIEFIDYVPMETPVVLLVE